MKRKRDEGQKRREKEESRKEEENRGGYEETTWLTDRMKKPATDSQSAQDTLVTLHGNEVKSMNST